MAGLRVFVSSTCVDLGAQRTQVRSLLERMGYEPVMSEYSDVLFDHRLHTHTSCIKEIANADMVVLLIGSRFGGAATPEALSDIAMEEIAKASSKTDIIRDKHRLSITQVEILKAIESDVPIFVFVDSKIHSDHHLYQKNKDADFADKIIYPSVEKPETSKYIFEFINFITHRFANNAITPYSNFSDIENHLTKQWSMTFQRLLREERDKSVDGRRSDAILEQIQDLKAAVLQSMSAGSGKEIARSVLRYRRLADFLLQMRVFNANIDLPTFQGSFEELLEAYGVSEIRFAGGNGAMYARTILMREDGTHIKVRIPDRRFLEFSVEWKGFSQLDRETKEAVLDGLEGSDSTSMTMVFHVLEPYEDDESREPSPDSSGPVFWTDERIAILSDQWSKGRTASEIANLLGISRNAVIGKAHRLGFKSRPIGTS